MTIELLDDKARRAKHSAIARNQQLLKAATFIPSLLPVVPPVILAPLALVCGSVSGYLSIKKARLNDTKETDSRYRTPGLEDCTIAGSTPLGLGMEIGAFKAGMAKMEAEHGRLGADQRREYLAQVFDQMIPVSSPDSLLTRHNAFIGQTGVGKTETMLAMLQSVINRGGGGLIFEAKGDSMVPRRIAQMMKAAGREMDFRCLNLADPRFSHDYNPCLSGTTRSTISTAMMLQGTDGEQFFRDVNRHALTAAIVCLKAQRGNPAFSLRDLLVLFTDINEFALLYEKMPQQTEDQIQARIFVHKFLKSYATYDKDGNEVFASTRYAERLQGLVSSIASFCFGEYGKLANSYNPDIELTRSIVENQVVVVTIPSLSDSEGAQLFGKLFIADFMRAIGDVQAMGIKPAVPYFAFFDEYPSFKAEFHEKLWQLARSANVSLNMSAQGYSFLANESEYFAKNILANCWNHFFYDVRDPETRELAAKLAGTVIRLFETTSEGTSSSRSASSEKSGLISQESQGTTYSTGSKATREDLLQPEDFFLEEGDAILIGKSESYRLRLPIVDFQDPAPDWKDIVLPKYATGSRQGINLWRKSYDRNPSFRHMINA